MRIVHISDCYPPRLGGIAGHQWPPVDISAKARAGITRGKALARAACPCGGVDPGEQPLAALHRDLFCESNPIPVKWGVHAMGMIDAGIRLPLTWLSAAAEPTVRAALQAAGIKITI
mgnify:CR=1 FL=1